MAPSPPLSRRTSWIDPLPPPSAVGAGGLAAPPPPHQRPGSRRFSWLEANLAAAAAASGPRAARVLAAAHGPSSLDVCSPTTAPAAAAGVARRASVAAPGTCQQSGGVIGGDGAPPTFPLEPADPRLLRRVVRRSSGVETPFQCLLSSASVASSSGQHALSGATSAGGVVLPPLAASGGGGGRASAADGWWSGAGSGRLGGGIQAAPVETVQTDMLAPHVRVVRAPQAMVHMGGAGSGGLGTSGAGASRASLERAPPKKRASGGIVVVW